MKYTIEPAKYYNEQQQNPLMRFRTDSGKDRQTGYVVKYNNGNVQWFPNFGLANKRANENPEGTPTTTISNYDHNS